MTKTTRTAAAPEQHNGTANPPTIPVEGTEPAYPPEPVEGVDVVPPAAPVFEGGDPGTAVPSAANDDPDYYHPVPPVEDVPATAETSEGDNYSDPTLPGGRSKSK